MADFEISHSGLGHPKNTTALPYGTRHLTDFMDVWPTKGPAFGIDHLCYEDEDVELRIQGDTLDELLERLE